MPNITLFCYIQGDNPDNIFKVNIERNKPISNLKKEIRNKNPDVFTIHNIGKKKVKVDIDIDKLWKVDIPLDENDKLNIDDIEEFESEELDVSKRVVEYFSAKLPDKHIHIIVELEQINVALFGLT